ncbi:MAG: glycine--tRNA ligase subunit beta [Legionellaceae bacterium]|nr:glycine--tRNA ligase subunit beta [Legionellaceae bacterium]
MKSHDFLFELGTEELPSGAVKLLSESLASNISAALSKGNIGYGKVRAFATPRRLAVLIHDVETTQASQSISRRGPAVNVSMDAEGKPLPALLGFAKSCGVGIDALTQITTDKGTWWAYEALQPGMQTRDLLLSLVNDSLAALPIAKPMRWGDGDAEFSRPVHWAVLLFGDEVLPGTILGVATGDLTYGHRFHHPQAVKIAVPCLYESSLKDAMVIADFSYRRQLISQQINQLATEHDMQAIVPESLLDEVTSIVEWPQAMLASFDSAFLAVPSEALIASMQSHQKCFALRDKNGQLCPHFITVTNIQSSDPMRVILGNEKVMRARLSDAAFFYHQDKKQPLNHHVPATEKVIFQVRLGSLADKTRRMACLMDYLAQPLELNREQAQRAAYLSKCDLLTGMVGEFPELQGLMGYYYAHYDGESMAVAEALNEQYMPKFAGDNLPASPLGTALSLADRLDTMVGLFGIGQKPTGVKDPFKLRRHALAIVRMLILMPVQVNISTLIEEMYRAYGDRLPDSAHALMLELKHFILERMQSYYQAKGIPLEFVYAVRARQDEWLFDADKRINALVMFVQMPEAASLSAICKRVNNLLSQAVDGSSRKSKKVQVSLLTEPAEQALYEQMKLIEKSSEPHYVTGDYSFILSQLASLKQPLDAFFDQVMVLVDDEQIKQNRLCLLVRLQQLLQGVADIALLGNIAVGARMGVSSDSVS